jgi:hypothetical protein
MGVQNPKDPSASTSRVAKMYGVVTAVIDRVVSPATRQRTWENTTAFAKENPLLFVSAFASRTLLSVSTAPFLPIF